MVLTPFTCVVGEVNEIKEQGVACYPSLPHAGVFSRDSEHERRSSGIPMGDSRKLNGNSLTLDTMSSKCCAQWSCSTAAL